MDVSPVGSAPDLAPLGAAPPGVAIDPVMVAAVPVVAAAFCVLRAAGLVAPLPYWVLLSLVAGAGAVTVAAARWWSDPGPGWHMPTFVVVDTAVIAAVAYATGWGPLLAVGFVFGAATAIRLFGSRAAPWAAGCTALAMVMGQWAIATNVAPSLVSRSILPGLTALGGLGAVLTIALIGVVSAARDRLEAELSHSERRFKALVADATDVIMVVAPDGTLRYASPAFERNLGLSPTPFFTESVAAIVHPDDAARISQQLAGPGAEPATAFRTRLRVRDAGGTWRHFESSVTDRTDDPDVGGIVGTWHEVTDLLEANARFRSAFEEAPIGMALASADGVILRSNRAFGAIVGRAPEDLAGTSVLSITHPDDRDRTAAELHRVAEQRDDGYQLEKRYVRPDGSEVWALAHTSCTRDAVGDVKYIIAQVQDVTEARRMREDLAHAAIHDHLTGLPNRTLFVDRLERALQRAGQRQGPVAVAFLDLDRFKLVNDGLGHAAGDELLQAVAARLQQAAGQETTVARFGGDEFTVLWEEVVDGPTALTATRRILDALRQPFELEGTPVFVSASAGVAVGRPHPAPRSSTLGAGRPGSGPSTKAAGMLRDADTAMYRAKEAGPGRAELFDARSQAAALQHLHVANELHSALAAGELRLHYQPIVDLATGSVVAGEALVRWQHPRRGLLAPVHFIGVAEECGLIVPLGTWVLTEACRQGARWNALVASDRPPIQMHVNIAPRQLVDPDFVEAVAQALDGSGLAPEELCLEITESTLMRDEEMSADALHALRALGVRISIDDFGTGYSSLSYLKRFPIDSLKVDRSFVDGLGEEGDDPVIVSAVIALAHSLGLTAVAEGVETEQALEELVQLGCDRVQGYLLGRPAAAEVVERRLLVPPAAGEVAAAADATTAAALPLA